MQPKFQSRVCWTFKSKLRAAHDEGSELIEFILSLSGSILAFPWTLLEVIPKQQLTAELQIWTKYNLKREEKFEIYLDVDYLEVVFLLFILLGLPTILNWTSVNYCISADVGEVKISIYQGIQPEAFQLAGGLLPCHGCGGTVYYKVYFDWNGSMDTIYLLRNIHKVVLVSRVSLLQPSLAFHCCHLGNNCLQPLHWFGQV